MVDQASECYDPISNVCEQGLTAMVDLAQGKQAMVSAVRDGEGGFISGGMFWLDGGLLFTLQIGPPGAFSIEAAVAIAGEFIADVGGTNLLKGAPLGS